MKEGIHPTYPPARVSCACGQSFVTRSTRGDFQVDVCSACHPFYTGTQKLLDTAGRVDRFRKRYEGNAAKVASKVNTGTPKKEKAAVVEAEAAPEAAAEETKAD